MKHLACCIFRLIKEWQVQNWRSDAGLGKMLLRLRTNSVNCSRVGMHFANMKYVAYWLLLMVIIRDHGD